MMWSLHAGRRWSTQINRAPWATADMPDNGWMSTLDTLYRLITCILVVIDKCPRGSCTCCWAIAAAELNTCCRQYCQRSCCVPPGSAITTDPDHWCRLGVITCSQQSLLAGYSPEFVALEYTILVVKSLLPLAVRFWPTCSMTYVALQGTVE